MGFSVLSLHDAVRRSELRVRPEPEHGKLVGGNHVWGAGSNELPLLGDCLLEWKRVLADGGIQAGSSEGTEDGDVTIAEDNQVFTGVINALTPTSVTVGCTLACNTEGPDRLVIDYQSASAINGNFATGNVGTTDNWLGWKICDHAAGST